MLKWTRANLDTPGVGNIGPSNTQYEQLLTALDLYADAGKTDPDDQSLVPVLRQVRDRAEQQLTQHPTEERNAAVARVRDDAHTETGRVLLATVHRADRAMTADPNFRHADAVLLATDAYLREFAKTDDATIVAEIRDRIMYHKMTHAMLLNTGSTAECNLVADKWYYTKPRMAVPADINCGLCTAAAVITAVTGSFVTTSDVVRMLSPNPQLVDAAKTGLAGRDYATVYQHPESFVRFDRTLQGGNSMADLAKTAEVNVKAAAGIKKVAQMFGVAEQGTQSDALPFAEAVQAMLQPTYEGCVFAVLIASAGHWNLARRTPDGLVFVDYQTDRPDRQGPQIGTTPQMGVKPIAAERDLGTKQNVSFLAFSR
ncbi:hypothetical protein [Nocardia sp. BMG111209]|uniref:hypothetical protein n=1 Tax=Nocardia sp. BMG111209 TaxID=1160137 RepID=UPI000376D31D|nr:hypothetical protein [Nocardia sp. BMG111209]